MAKKNQTVESKSLLDKLDAFMEKNGKIVFGVIILIAALVSIGIFDPRVSLTGDDSTYILNAKAFVSDFIFPGYQGPLYPIALSLVVLPFGISLLPLKVFSLLSMLGFFFVTYISFRKRIPSAVLFSVLLVLALSSPVLYYASQTYSEAFFMLVQSLVILVFFRFFIDKSAETKTTKTLILHHLYLALVLLALATSRSIGFAGIAAVAAYFILQKEWKNLLISIAFFAAVFVLYTLLRTVIWGNGDLQFASQGTGLLRKDFYHPELGNEDFTGLLVRFWQNSVQYLSFALFNIAGFLLTGNSVFLTLMVFALVIGTLFISFKRNKYIFFSALISGTSLLVTFVVLQAFWNQDRLIIPFYAYLLFCFFYVVYYLFSFKRARSFQFLYFVVVALFVGAGLKNTSTALEAASHIHNKYSGLAPDWIHYIKASEWAAENLKADDVVACRKPTISSVYADGKKFHGIHVVPVGNTGAFMKKWAAAPNDYFAALISDKFYELPVAVKPYCYAFMQLGQYNFWVVQNSAGIKDSFVANGVTVADFEQISSLSSQVTRSDVFSVIYPDSLLNTLKKGNVTHILSASLRLNPQYKTGETISTVERYAYFIQAKYPTIFELVHNEGAPDDEPAQIFRINWGVVK